jgi:alcohol dehydrogenase class IV
MSISFTSSIISRLKREIADIQKQSTSDKIKREKALSKIKQLQKNIKMSSSPTDLSSKMTQITKLTEEAARIEASQAAIAKQLTAKNAELRQQLAKNAPQDQQ